MTSCTTLAFPAVVSCPAASTNATENSGILIGVIATLAVVLILVFICAIFLAIFVASRNQSMKKGGSDQQNPP